MFLAFFILFSASFIDYVATSILIYRQGLQVELNSYLYIILQSADSPYLVLFMVKFLPFIILFLCFKQHALKLCKGVKVLTVFATVFQTIIACYGSYVVLQS